MDTCGRTIDLGGSSISVKATDEQTPRVVHAPRNGWATPLWATLHIHHAIAEAFYVLEGEYLIFIHDRETRCSAGSFIFIPAETPHGFRVGNVASRKLNLYLPASMVGYFDDLSEAMRKGRVRSGAALRDRRPILHGGDRASAAKLPVRGVRRFVKRERPHLAGRRRSGVTVPLRGWSVRTFRRVAK
jgi:mannose-6-phosphate isomerase-like protein (cupin superfamily)